MPDTEFHLRPWYLVLGVAAERRQATEQLLVELRDELATQPTLGDRIRLGVIEFSGRATVRLPLGDPLDPALPVLPPPVGSDDGNSLAAALSLVRETIGADATTLTAAGFLVDRPVVWLIVDRDPTDAPEAQRTAFDELTGPPGSPYILPCGIGRVSDDVLRPLIHPSGGGETTAVGYIAEVAGALAPVLAAAIIRTAAREADQLGLILTEAELLPAEVRTIPAVVSA